MSTFRAGLLDTSVFIAQEAGRELESERLPEEGFVSVITWGELHAGVHVAADTDTRARRLRTLERVGEVSLLTVGPEAAAHWGRLRARLAEAGRRASVNDLWIAAIALANDLPVVTQASDFDVLAELELVSVVRV